MRRSRFTHWVLGFAALAACDRADPPTMPAARTAPLLARDQESRNSSYFNFRNQTGQAVSRLVIQFNGEITAVPFAAVPTVETNGASLALSSASSATFTPPPLDSVLVAATVDARNIRIERWYWADASGAALGGSNKGCSVKQGCESVPPPFGFTIVSSPAEVFALGEVAYCYYFRTPNAESLAVRTWRAKFGPAVKRVIVMLTTGDAQPPFTQSSAACAAFVGGTPVARRWAFIANQSGDELTFPGNDGSGKPIGLVIPPGQSGYLYIHFKNPIDTRITSHVEVEAVPYERGTVVTPAASFYTYNNSINIAAGATADSEMQNCRVPSGAKFFYLTIAAHKQMVHAYVRDGPFTVFESTDPFNPGSRSWSPPFYTFATEMLTHEFVYDNPTNRTIMTGPSNATDEEAVTMSYFIPGTASKLCFDGFGPF